MQAQMNVEQAAQLLGLSVNTIYAYVARRRLPFRKIGARVVFDPEEIERWLKSKAVPVLSNAERHRNALAAIGER